MVIGIAEGIGLGISALGLFKKSKAPKLDLAGLRANAKANGFNPLTVLRLTGGAGHMTSGSDIGVKLTNFGSMLTDFGSNQRALASKDKMDAAAIDLMGAQRDLALSQLKATTGFAGGSGGRLSKAAGASVVKETDGFDRSDFFRGPAAFADQPWVDVFNAAGTPFRIRQGIADRFKLGAGSVMIQEDFEGVLGDVWSEFQATGMIGDAWWNGVDIFKGGHSSGFEPQVVPEFESGVDTILDAITKPTSPVVPSLRQGGGPETPYPDVPVIQFEPPTMRVKPKTGWMDEKFKN